MGGAQVQALIGAWKQIVGHTPRRGVYGRGHERYGGDHHPYFGGGEEVIDASVQPYDGGDQVVEDYAEAFGGDPNWNHRRHHREHGEHRYGVHVEHGRGGRHADVRGWKQIVGAQESGSMFGRFVRNELIDEREPDRAGREILPMSSGIQTILPAHSASITARPQRVAFRPERVFISSNGDGAENWLVNDILIGNRSQFSQAGQIPGDIFATTAIDSFVTFETAQTAMDVVMVITYVGPTSDGQPFYGAIIGTAAV